MSFVKEGLENVDKRGESSLKMRGKLNKITEGREKLIFDSFAKLCFGQKSILIGKVMKISL